MRMTSIERLLVTGLTLLLAVAPAISLTLLATDATAQEAQPIYNWTDEPSRDGDITDWRPNIRDTPYFENWDVWLWADDGTFIVLQFLTSSFGFGIERQGSARLLIVDPHAANIHGGPEDGVGWGDRGFNWDNGDWGWEELEGAVDVHWADCYLRGDGTTLDIHMRGRTRQNWLRVELTADSPVYRPGDGRLNYGWDRRNFYDLQAIPRVSFSGELNQKENRDAEDDWRPISGVGYVEHSLTNAFPFDIAESFFGFRALRADGLSVVLDSVMTPGGFGQTPIPWLLVLLDGEIIFESFDVSIIPNDERREEWGGNSYELPYGYDVEARAGGDLVQLQVYNSELVSADSFLNRVSSFLRAVIRQMMTPYDFELSNEYSARVTIDGTVATVSGRGWTTFQVTN
ncbi:MAG: hypothetical protein ACI81R_000377 [Bradymonadia bacterium]|jgi:hypothetical protein